MTLSGKPYDPYFAAAKPYASQFYYFNHEMLDPEKRETTFLQRSIANLPPEHTPCYLAMAGWYQSKDVPFTCICGHGIVHRQVKPYLNMDPFAMHHDCAMGMTDPSCPIAQPTTLPGHRKHQHFSGGNITQIDGKNVVFGAG